MFKRGQITFFIIIGISFLFIMLFFFFVKQETIGLPLRTAPAVELMFIKNYISNCLERSSETAVWENGLIGGYENPTDTVIYNGENIPVYEQIPSINDMEESIGRSILDEFDNCFDMNIVKRFGFNLTLTEPKKVNVSIYNKSILVLFDFPLNIQKGDHSTEMPYFLTIMIPLELGELYENSVKLVNKANAYSFYNITPDCHLYDTNGFTNVNIINVGNDRVIKFINYDTYATKYLKSYIFRFALKNKQIAGECIG